MEQELDAIVELVGLFLAHILDPRTVVAERRIGHGAVDQRVVDAIELQGEEQKMRRRSRDAFLHIAIELGARRIGGVVGINQAGI